MTDWVPAAQASKLFPQANATEAPLRAGSFQPDPNPYSAPASAGTQAVVAYNLRTPSAQISVHGPAIGLIVAGSLAGVSCIFHGLVTVIAGVQRGRDPAYAAGAIAATILLVAINGFICFSATQMMKRESYRGAVAASILALMPCSLCFWLSIPMGIWSLVILLQPQVKASFRS